jgi:hypothetical protein
VPKATEGHHPLSAAVGHQTELGEWPLAGVNEHRGSHHRTVCRLFLITVSMCACLHAFVVGQAISGEYRLADTLDLTDPASQLTVSYKIPSLEQQPVLVLYGSGILRYIHGASLEELLHRYLPGGGWRISKDGTHLGMCTESHDYDSRTTTRWFRVEDWKGDLLWRMKLRPCYRYLFHVTNSGHAIIFPNVHRHDPLGLSDRPPIACRDEPPIEIHGLLVYDAQGGLVLEGVEHREYGASFHSQAAVSPEGQYLAFLFRWVPEKSRECDDDSEDDKACLVLYDLEVGAELWRHYFSEKMPGGVAVGSGAERVLCFVRRGDARFPAEYDMFLLDRQGGELMYAKVTGTYAFDIDSSLSSSADGRVSVFIDYHNRVYVVEMFDGGSSWQWLHPADELFRGSFGVSSDGTIAMYGKELNGDTEEHAVENIYVHSKDGALIQVIPLGFPVVPRAAPVSVGISRDGGMLWMAHRSLRLYRWH